MAKGIVMTTRVKNLASQKKCMLLDLGYGSNTRPTSRVS